MAKQKKPNVDDIEKLRKILDNPSDPYTARIVSPTDTSLDSVRRRLTQKTPVSRTIPSVAPSKSSSSLQPTVTIHPRVRQAAPAPAPISKSAPSLPEFEPIPTPQGPASTAGPLPEFTPVSSTEGIEIPAVPEEPSFEDEDLIEIEKVDTTYPEFSPAAITEEEGTQGSITTSDTLTEKDLPLWKPVTETTQHDFTFTEKPRETEEIPEFTPSEPQPPHKETPEKPWTPPVEEEAAPAPLVPTRAQKKAERQRQKQQKRQQKLEQKRARKEAKQKEKEAKQQKNLEEQKARMQAIQEPETPLFTPAPETPPAPEEPVEEPVDQPRAIKLDISAFKDIESIDDHIGELLYRNGYFSLDDLRKATIDDLVQIRGIKRKLAKKIKKEVEQKTVSKPDQEFISVAKKPSAKKPSKRPEDVSEWESFSVNNHEDVVQSRGATYGEYTLYKKERGKGADKTTVHLFSKQKPANGTPVPLPRGYEIAVNKRTKVPYLKKKK